MNLYPFERVSSRRGVDEKDVIENIDVGGPTLIRAAAKNHDYAAVVVSPESYDAVLDELRESEGKLSDRTRESLALEAFAYTARYDTAIARWFAEREDDFPASTRCRWRRSSIFPTGEPAPARGLLRRGRRAHAHAVDGVEAPRQGAVVQQPPRPRLRPAPGGGVRAAGGGHHQAQQPVWRGGGGHPDDAFELALATDRQSAYGGVFCFNRAVERALAEQLGSMFVEVVLAPGFSDEALEILQAKPDVRLLEIRSAGAAHHRARHKRVRGGLLVQDRDTGLESREEMRAVRSAPDRGGVGRAPVRDARLQARALERDRALEGPRQGGHRRGADEPRGLGEDRRSRRPRLPTGADRGGHGLGRVLPIRRRTASSAIEAGVRAIIQPGGSRRDSEDVNACDEAGVAMVFTARRHFRH